MMRIFTIILLLIACFAQASIEEVGGRGNHQSSSTEGSSATSENYEGKALYKREI